MATLGGARNLGRDDIGAIAPGMFSPPVTAHHTVQLPALH